MSKTSENTDKLLKFVAEKFQNDELDNDSLVQLIELAGAHLNLQTISDYAKANNISYTGAKKFRKTVKIFNVNFIIDNQ
jgi:hypothetical protein